MELISRQGSCINRNIVECKYHLLIELILIDNVLIETLWNVNLL